jgi:hypothetical protein
MTALYLLAAERRAELAKLADLDLDEQTLADTLESLTGDLENKAENVAIMVRMIEADAASCRAWAGDALARAKVIEGRAERLREYLQTNLEAVGIEKITGPGVEISFRKSSAVVVDAEDLLPTEFWRRPPMPLPAPDKNAIALAIKGGREVPGAHVETRRSLQIK